jgi:hypothetical protein
MMLAAKARVNRRRSDSARLPDTVRGSHRATWVGLGLLTALVLWPTPAEAYRTAADLPEYSGASVYWRSPRIRVSLYRLNPTGVSLAEMERALNEALDVWRATPCGVPELEYVGASDSPAAADDGVVTIEFVTGGWDGRGFDPTAAAVTDVGYFRADATSGWEISDADVFINAERYQWTAYSASTTGTLRSLTMALIHELGHVLGLLHPCELDGSDGAPICSGVPEFRGRTMYPEYVDGAMASPGDDDVSGLCFLYPGACAPGSCAASQACTETGCRDLCGAAPCADGQSCVLEICIPCPDGACGDVCAIDAHCATEELCENGYCLPRGRPLGDPCDAVHGCSDGMCGANGFCEPPCASEVACDGGLCASPSPLSCPDALGVLGDSCDYSTDCLGQRCIEGATPSPVCTRLCAPDSPCPPPWTCTLVEGQDVCRPPTTGSDGCTITGTGHASGTFNTLGACLLALIASVVGRRPGSRRFKENA